MLTRGRWQSSCPGGRIAKSGKQRAGCREGSERTHVVSGHEGEREEDDGEQGEPGMGHASDNGRDQLGTRGRWVGDP